MNNKRFSYTISVFHGIKAPEKGQFVGYGALIEKYNLKVPVPNN